MYRWTGSWDQEGDHMWEGIIERHGMKEGAEWLSPAVSTQDLC